MDKPKYYRCISTNNDPTSNFTVGKIYKIINPDNLEDTLNFIDDKKISNGWSGDNWKHFTPVTELEWNLQKGIVTLVNKEDLSYLIELLTKLNII